jgi:hypothetical protein
MSKFIHAVSAFIVGSSAANAFGNFAMWLGADIGAGAIVFFISAPIAMWTWWDALKEVSA